MGLAVRQVLNIVYLQCAVAVAESVLTIITEPTEKHKSPSLMDSFILSSTMSEHGCKSCKLCKVND